MRTTLVTLYETEIDEWTERNVIDEDGRLLFEFKDNFKRHYELPFDSEEEAIDWINGAYENSKDGEMGFIVQDALYERFPQFGWMIDIYGDDLALVRYKQENNYEMIALRRYKEHYYVYSTMRGSLQFELSEEDALEWILDRASILEVTKAGELIFPNLAKTLEEQPERIEKGADMFKSAVSIDTKDGAVTVIKFPPDMFKDAINRAMPYAEEKYINEVVSQGTVYGIVRKADENVTMGVCVNLYSESRTGDISLSVDEQKHLTAALTQEASDKKPVTIERN